MRFKSRDGSVKRVCMPDGRIALVGPEWREVPDNMIDATYAAGCMSDEALSDLSPPPAAKKPYLGPTVAEVKDAMKAILEDGDPKAIMKDGTIKHAAINTRMNMMIEKAMFQQAWAELQLEAGE